MKSRIYRFAGFELIAAEGELRKGDLSVRLQEKPLLLLTALLESPQELVTREQLRERMWDSQTFVDYEQGINVAIKKIRDSLGDSAEQPRFIQTVSRKGYRFLVQVEVTEQDVNVPSVRGPQPISADVGTQSCPTPPRRRTFIVTALAAVALIASGLWFFLAHSKRPHSVSQIRSLAVLPLRNLSPDSGQDYLADGVTEELITDLAQSLPLRVISRTSAMRYKQANEPITRIARELGVEAIVEGAVARSGNHVMVTVQLIDATEDRHLWAQKYDRDVKDLLVVEGELAQEIASQVGSTLAAQKIANDAVSRPVDPQVHELCLLGRYYWNKRTAADLAKAAEYYQRAVDRDPRYAPAHAGLATVYAISPHYNHVEIQGSFAKAAAEARQALELDDTSAEAHATLGFVALSTPVWKQSEREFRRALELNPNYATAHHWFAYYLLFSDRINEALAQIEVARKLDPLSAIINADEGQMLYAARRYDDARVRLRQAVELAPGLGQPLETLALIELEAGQAPEAMNDARSGLGLDPTNPRTMGEAGYVFASTGHVQEARKLLATLNDMVKQGSAYPALAGLIYMGLGRRREALGALEENARVGAAGFVQWHAFDELKGDPRYQKLIAEMQQ
jgi:TolB-like protein/DNA-binding winged helix-turn-helix (wHTH) protein/Tfp pilus assembly protein PilF